MVPLLTSSDKFAHSVLAARDHRQECLERALACRNWPVLAVSLNIPGAEKKPAGCERLFEAALRSLCRAFPAHALHLQASDALGPFALVAVGADAAAAKRFAVALEDSGAAQRLLDVDVYEASGRQVDRAALGLAPRGCLVCQQAAVDCIRQRRHPAGQLSAKVHELLQAFAA